MSKKLDIYTDASIHNGTFGIGILVMSCNEELMKVSEVIPDEIGIESINDAELFGVCKAFRIINESKIKNADITIYTDSLRTINAVFGARYKGIQEEVFKEVIMLKTIITEVLCNRFYITKISGIDNHGFAHELARDSVSGKTYTVGSVQNSKLLDDNTKNMTIPDDFLRAGQQFQNLCDNISYKEVRLERLKEKIEKLKNEVNEKNKVNEMLAVANNLENLNFDKIAKEKENKEDLIVKLDDSICFQQEFIEKLNKDLERLTKSLKDTKGENQMRIKFLKEDFERLSIRSAGGHANKNEFAS